MPVEEVIANVITVIILLGGPIFPLLILAAEIGRWHADNPEPETVPELHHSQH